MRPEPAGATVARAAVDAVAFRGGTLDKTALDITFTANALDVVAASVIAAAVVVVVANLAVQRYPNRCDRAGDNALEPGIRGG